MERLFHYYLRHDFGQHVYVSQLNWARSRSGLNGTDPLDFKAHFFTLSHFAETKFNNKQPTERRLYF